MKDLAYTILISVQDENGTEVFVKVFDCNSRELLPPGYATPPADVVAAAIANGFKVDRS